MEKETMMLLEGNAKENSQESVLPRVLKWTSKMNISDHTKIKEPQFTDDSSKKEWKIKATWSKNCILGHMYPTKDTYPEYVKNYKPTGKKEWETWKDTSQREHTKANNTVKSNQGSIN